MARIYWSWLMVLQGDIAGALDQARTAQESEPLSPLVNGGVAHTFYLAKRYDEAIAECEKSLEVDPSFILAIHVNGMCRALQGRLAEAVRSVSGRYRCRVAHRSISAYWGTITRGVARPTRCVRLSSSSSTLPVTIRPTTLLRVHPCWVKRDRPSVGLAGQGVRRWRVALQLLFAPDREPAERPAAQR